MSRLPGEPRITPREIQMRVRAGEEPQALADAYGAGLDWVVRFAGPVLAERERMANEARRSKARRSTTEGQTVVFGEAVDERFSAHGIEPGTVRWDAHRREDGQWIVTAHWIGGQTERTAEWTFHLAARTVAPIDDTAADLLSDRPIRPVAPPEPPALALGGGLPGDARRAHRPAAARGRGGLRSGPVRRAAPAAARDPMPPTNSAASRALTQPRRAPPKDSETEDEKAARATIPSWDDILLGVRRKHD